MGFVVGREPAADRLRWEAPVGEGTDERSMGSEDAGNFVKDLDWVHEIVDRDTAGHGVEYCVSEWELGVAVEVVDDTSRSLGIPVEFDGIHTEDHQASRSDMEVRHPR